MNRTGGKRRAGGKQRKSRCLNVPGRNIVCDVDDVGDVGGGIAGENYSLNRRDKVVRGAKVGEQGDERHAGTLRRGDGRKRRLLTRSPLPLVSAFGFHL